MFLSGANLCFNTRGHHWLISCSFSPKKHLPAQYRIGNLSRFPSPSLVLGCNHVGKILKESGESTGSSCHLHPCCTPPTYRSDTGSCFDFPPCWYSPDVFKDHIQWCAGKYTTTNSQTVGEGCWFAAFTKFSGVNTPPWLISRNQRGSEETHCSTALHSSVWIQTQ